MAQNFRVGRLAQEIQREVNDILKNGSEIRAWVG